MSDPPASTSAHALASAAMLSALRSIVPRMTGDPLALLETLPAGHAFEEAGVEGFLEGLEDLALFETPPSADEVHRILRRLDATGNRSLGMAYMASVPRARRHGSGEYYTPGWLVEHVLDRAGFGASTRMVDPMCGAGAFLAAAVRRLRRERPEMDARDIVDRVHGFDLNPLAVLLARAEYLMALGPPRRGQRIRIPVQRADILALPRAAEPFDIVAGNPPWVGWESLDHEMRSRTKHLWEYHGLFTGQGHGSMQVMLGGGKKDLCMLATYAAAEALLKPGGRLSFVITLSAFKSGTSGAGFRRFTLGDGTPLRVLGVDDFSSIPVFAGASARACVLTLERGSPTFYPIPWRAYARSARREASASGRFVLREELAEPVDPRDPTSAWVTGGAASIRDLRSIAGPSTWRARAGAYTGGANGVFWVEVLERRDDGTCLVRNLATSGLRSVPSVTTRIEEGLLFPLLRARDVGRFHAAPSAHIIISQDPTLRRGIAPAEMEARWPLALEYLETFREALAARRDRGTRSLIDAGAPFWSIFSVSNETMSDWKVVWRRIASRVEAAPVGPAGDGHHGSCQPVIPQETCTFVACASREEACFLAGLLNTTRFNDAARAFGQVGGKGFAPPRLLERIAVPRYDPAIDARRDLAERVRVGGRDLPQADIDSLAEAAWPLA